MVRCWYSLCNLGSAVYQNCAPLPSPHVQTAARWQGEYPDSCVTPAPAQEALSSCPTPRAVRIGTGNSHCFDAANSELPTGSDLLFFGSEYGPFSRCVEVGSALEVLRPDSTAYYQVRTACRGSATSALRTSRRCCRGV